MRLDGEHPEDAHFVAHLDDLVCLFEASGFRVTNGRDLGVAFSFPGSTSVEPIGTDWAGRGALDADVGHAGDGCRACKRLIYPGLYDGIDLVLTADPALKYEFLVHPGGHPGNIRIQVDGKITVGPRGDRVDIAAGDLGLVDDGLVAFNQGRPDKVIGCRYRALSRSSYGFELDAHDTDGTVVIDPFLRTTFFGGDDYDRIIDIVIDAEGNVVVAGETWSLDFPGRNDTVDTDTDIFISTLDPECSTLLGTTMISGSKDDELNEMVMAEDGSLFIVGDTVSDDLPVTPDALQSARAGYTDGFVMRLAASTHEVLYATYLGGSGNETVISATPMGQDGVIITGESASEDLPTTDGVLQEGLVNDTDGFIAIFDSMDGSPDAVITYLGGTGYDVAVDVVALSDGSISMCGGTMSDDLPVTGDALQDAYQGGWTDCFYARVSRDLSTLHYLTYLGGPIQDFPLNMVLDDEGCLHIFITTTSRRFGSLFSAENQTDMDYDILMVAYDPSTNSVLRSKYLSGSEADYVLFGTLGTHGDLYLCGGTVSTDFPTTYDACSSSINNSRYEDGILCRFNASTYALEYSTYFGGERSDRITALAHGVRREVYFAGRTYEDDLPIDLNAYQVIFGGGHTDGFISSVNTYTDTTPPVAEAGPDVVINQSETAHFDGIGSMDELEIKGYTWVIDNGTGEVRLEGMTAEHRFDEAGEFEVRLEVVDWAGNVGLDDLTVTVQDTTPPVADPGDDLAVDQRETFVLDGSSSTDNVGVVDYLWSYEEDGSPVELEGAEVELAFEEAGSVTVTLTVVDARGNSDEATVEVTVRDITPPVVDIGGDLEVPQHRVVILDGGNCTDNVGITGWNWTVETSSGELGFTTEEVEFVLDGVGVYRVTLSASDGAGNEASDTISVRVLDTTDPVARGVVEGPGRMDVAMTFDGGNSTDNVGIVQWRWTFVHDSEDVVLEGERVEYVFRVAGNYTVELEIMDAAGNADTDELTFRIEDDKRTEGGELLLPVILVVVLIAAIVAALALHRRRSTAP